MENNNNQGITIGGDLFLITFIVFLVLKLTGTVTWSWWLVTLPIWCCPALAVGIFGIIIALLIVFGVLALIGYLILMLYDRITE